MSYAVRDSVEWSKKEDYFLSLSYKRGKTFAEISKAHLRTEDSIRSRVIQLNIFVHNLGSDKKKNITSSKLERMNDDIRDREENEEIDEATVYLDHPNPQYDKPATYEEFYDEDNSYSTDDIEDYFVNIK